MKFKIVFWAAVTMVSLAAEATLAQNIPPARQAPDAADTMPMLRLEPGGPTSFVSALAFNPSGNTLYAGGWDKVVRAWSWDPVAKHFVLDAPATYRVPIGPALDGVINAIAVSPDGAWLAAAGRGLVHGASDLRHPGWKVPAAGTMTAAMRLDQGTIYLFNTRTREVRALRAHTAPVVALAFAPAQSGKPPVLISAGQEWDDTRGRFSGAVRAWDARATYLGGAMLTDVSTRPSIVAWHTGRGLKQLRVAIAWGDKSESLRIWDVENNTLRSVRDGQYNNTAAWWPDSARLITGSTGRLKLWNISAGAAGDPAVERELRLANLEVPRALALFSSTDRGRIDRAAVVVKSAGAEVRLRLVDLEKFQLVNPFDTPLWNAVGILPSIAVVPGGRHLAIAGNPAHEIATFAVDDLLAGRTAPAMLRGSGISARNVAFVKQADSLGVLVSQRPKPAPGAAPANPAAGLVVFDASHRRVSNDLSDWRIAQPAPSAWRVDVSAATDGQRAGQKYLSIREGDRVVRQIWLPAGHTLTDYALLPPSPTIQRPLLALATHELGQPLLEIYDVITGTPVRELSGHLAPIDALAFSEDGKLLVTAAGDRTICVWNMADLDRVLGVRGALRGIVLEKRGESLLVTDVAPDSPYRAGPLAANDKLLGWVRSEGIEPMGSLIDFYLQVSRTKPGETLALRRQREQNQPETIQVSVGQGTDERKPLFTLFVAEAGQGDRWNWIGWSPLGPYESSGDEVERLLGWHFNTDVSSAPTRFALAGEYQSLRREGLIEQLLREGALGVEKPRPLDRPSTSIRLKQSEPGLEMQIADGHAPLRFAGRQAELNLEIRGLAPDQVSSVTWRTAGAEARAFEPISPQAWAATLSDLPRERRGFKVQLAVTTQESDPQIFAEEVALVYQPPAPVFEQVFPAAESSVVTEPALSFRAQVRSLEKADGDLKISLLHTAGGKQVAEKQFTHAGQLNIDEPFKLQPGDNTISVVATNADALDSAVDQEQTVLVRRISYSPEAVPPPELLIEAIAPETGTRQALTSDQTQPLVVDITTLRIEGHIVGKKPLVRAEWYLGDEAAGRPFGDFAPNAANKIEVAEAVVLQPGPQRLRCVAQAKGGLPTEVSIAVEFRPRLPELFLTAPQNDTDLIEGRDLPHVKLTGRLNPVADKHPFQAAVLLNGRKVPDSLMVDAAGETFSGEAAMENGENRIEVQLSNAWGAKATSEAVRVRYLRPPQIVAVTAPTVVEAPLVDVDFVIDSPAKLELTRLMINDRELPADAAVVERAGPDTTRWKVKARDVPLREGENQIRPLARNGDGWSVITKTAQVTVMRPAPPKAEIEFLTPPADRTVETPQFSVGFVVRSLGRLKRVELRNDTHLVSAIDVSQQTQEPRPGGKPASFRLETTAPVTLNPRDNHIQVVAVNDGGESEARVTVTYVRKPVEVVIDQIASQDQAKSVLKPEIQEGGRVVFAQPVPDGNVWLRGRVRWPDAASQQIHRVSMVHIWVNGFLQIPAPLKSNRPADLEWAWQARIRLSRARGNEISVRLPGVATVADSRLSFKVHCLDPDERQRLHLFVVGVGEKDAGQLEALALSAIQGKRVVGDQITSPAFPKGWIYLISGYVNRGRVTAQLDRIHLRVGDLKSADAANDVVVVYYHGQETVDDQGQFYLLTSQSQYDQDNRSSALSGRDLSDRFASVPGAQIFLLDLQRKVVGGPKMSDDQEVSAKWPHDPQMAALRYVWLSSETPPADARLLVAFNDAVPRANRLGEIETEVSRSSQRAREKYGPTFEYEPRIPEPLRNLLLAKPALPGG
jgi:WD40 repeat protein